MSDEKKLPVKIIDTTEQIIGIELLDPRQKSLSHKLYHDVEEGLKNLVMQAKEDKEMSVSDKTKIYNLFIKYRKDLFQDVHLLIQCLKELPKEQQDQFFIVAEKLQLDNALRNNKSKSLFT